MVDRVERRSRSKAETMGILCPGDRTGFVDFESVGGDELGRVICTRPRKRGDDAFVVLTI
jgi:hypothetical protein